MMSGAVMAAYLQSALSVLLLSPLTIPVALRHTKVWMNVGVTVQRNQPAVCAAYQV